MVTNSTACANDNTCPITTPNFKINQTINENAKQHEKYLLYIPQVIYNDSKGLFRIPHSSKDEDLLP